MIDWMILMRSLAFGIILSVMLKLYVTYARRNNVLDKPNERSSHVHPTVLGAGVLFMAASILGFIESRFNLPLLFVSLIIGGSIGFLDDRKGLSTRWRFFFYGLCAVLILSTIFNWTEGYNPQIQWWIYPILFVFILGVTNAYNFMDGINGITVLYSLVLSISCLYLFGKEFAIFESYLKVYLIALLVFGFGNIRKHALFFMGDVGSISLGLLASCLVFSAFAQDWNIAYLLLLAVYGVDSLATIAFRLMNKENITQAHRSHAYQLLSNEGKWGHLRVSVLYASLQLLINYLLYLSLSENFISPKALILAILISLSLLYIFIKHKYQREALPWIS